VKIGKPDRGAPVLDHLTDVRSPSAGPSCRATATAHPRGDERRARGCNRSMLTLMALCRSTNADAAQARETRLHAPSRQESCSCPQGELSLATGARTPICVVGDRLSSDNRPCPDQDDLCRVTSTRRRVDRAGHQGLPLAGYEQLPSDPGAWTSPSHGSRARWVGTGGFWDEARECPRGVGADRQREGVFTPCQGRCRESERTSWLDHPTAWSDLVGT
jgi:hypothetical protein